MVAVAVIAVQGVVTVVAVKLVGTRAAIDRLVDGGIQIDRVILTSGLSLHNPQPVQLMADVFQRDVRVAQIDEPTAVGAAIHGAVAGQVVGNYAEGAQRFLGAANFTTIDRVAMRPPLMIGSTSNITPSARAHSGPGCHAPIERLEHLRMVYPATASRRANH